MRGAKTLRLAGLASLPLPEPHIPDHGSPQVQPGDLFQFLFPSGFFHSKSTARLYIFAEYGPVLVLVRDGWMSLRSGYKGQHIVTEQELADMIEDMIKEDVLRVSREPVRVLVYLWVQKDGKHACMHALMNKRICACVYRHVTHIDLCIRACTYACVRTCINLLQIYIARCAYMHTYVRTHVCTYIHNTCMHART